ncbi:Uncharacterised protein [Mycobacteroides abscessus subsp. abscessus]|nr:Uncharacterised protein [Mycobacteroides abscessus subsp. abscessus]
MAVGQVGAHVAGYFDQAIARVEDQAARVLTRDREMELVAVEVLQRFGIAGPQQDATTQDLHVFSVYTVTDESDTSHRGASGLADGTGAPALTSRRRHCPSVVPLLPPSAWPRLRSFPWRPAS